jgi:hypothetical protein
MVPAAGFEPATYGLQNRCTTTVLSRQSARDYNRAGRAAGSGSLDRAVPDGDCEWGSGCWGRSAAVGVPCSESCADDDSFEETPTATPMITTTSADKVQERRSESSRPCMGDIVGLRRIPALRPGSQIAGFAPNDRVRPAVADGAGSTDGLCRAGCLDRLLPQEVHGRLIQSGPQLKAFMGSGDVANRNLHSADDWLDADARRP